MRLCQRERDYSYMQNCTRGLVFQMSTNQLYAKMSMLQTHKQKNWKQKYALKRRREQSGNGHVNQVLQREKISGHKVSCIVL